jgi:hypothetical protein
MATGAVHGTPTASELTAVTVPGSGIRGRAIGLL